LTAQKIAAGDTTCRIEETELRRGDEIGTLAKSLASMTENLIRLVDNQRRLLRDVSHDLRSNLARMKLALAVLNRKVPPSSFDNRYADQLEKDISRMDFMLQELLEHTRLEMSIQLAFERETLDITDLVKSCVEDYIITARELDKDISFQGVICAQISGNPHILKRVFDNLLANGLYYSPVGSNIFVNVNDDFNFVIIEVINPGSGVPEELLDKIFDPFYRVDEARQLTSGGFGLGLSIVDRAVKAHGGLVKASNTLDDSGKISGFKVTISLPKI
jgi:two-component system sensor histidine kinase CpxA